LARRLIFSAGLLVAGNVCRSQAIACYSLFDTVGHGANDGPEFAQTDIGLAIGTDAAVVIEASEVTLIIGFIAARHQPIGTAIL
jgi:hypothetical protein